MKSKALVTLLKELTVTSNPEEPLVPLLVAETEHPADHHHLQSTLAAVTAEDQDEQLSSSTDDSELGDPYVSSVGMVSIITQ